MPLIKYLLIFPLTLLGVLYFPPLALASTISLGSAHNFAVLGAATVTNTGLTTLTGDLGVSPGTAITGFPPGTVTNGVIQTDLNITAQAQIDAHSAYDELKMAPFTQDQTALGLSGLALQPGIYHFDSSANLTGALQLDFTNDPFGQFIFQIATTLTTANGSSVSVINGSADKVYWQIGSSASLGTNSLFAGNLLADQSITLTTGASLDGRAIALHAAVTMDSNTITTPSMSAVPLPATLPLLGFGLLGLLGFSRRRVWLK